MFRTAGYRYFIPLVCAFIIFGRGAEGQVPEHEVPELRKQAMSHYEEGDFASAGREFSKLIQQYPRDAMYRYYAGICNVELGRDLGEAVELLYYASSRGVPEDVYYYLGEAYRKTYDFERAKKYYLTFDREAPRSMTRERDSKLLIRSVNTAMQITSSYNPFEVQNITFIDLHDPEQAGQIKMKGGNFSLKPELFFTEKEEENGLNAWMFMPGTVTRGQVVYFAGLERNGKDGFQIMQAKKGNTGKWIDIKPVDVLNTDKDEILPYFDPVGKDIYFASAGREGLGGFDLYRSHYDEERDEWSEPVSLGFPVNSAYDDYLLLPGTDLGMVTFFSARQTSGSALSVYRVHLSEPKQSLASKTPEEIMEIANLGGVATKMIQEYETYKDLQAGNDLHEGPEFVPSSAASGTRPLASSGDAGVRNNSDAAGTEELHSAEASDPVYQSMISSALEHQAASDSLTELATEARIRVRQSDDPNEKWLSQRQIMVWEKKASEEQAEADNYFVKIASYNKTLEPSVIEKDTIINDITVYRYRDTGTGEGGVNEKPDVKEKARTAFTAKGNQSTNMEDRSRVAEASELARNVNAEPADHPVEGMGRKNQEMQEPENLPSGDVAKKAGESDGHAFSGNEQFDILAESSYSASNPIPMDAPLPGGTIYRIQMGVYSNLVAPATFDGITPINAMTDPDRNLIFYYAGNFQDYDQARDALAQVRARGNNDAFIVAWFNGKKMSIEKARKLQ